MFDYLVAHGRMKEKEARAKFRQVCIAFLYVSFPLTPVFMLKRVKQLSFAFDLDQGSACCALVALNKKILRSQQYFEGVSILFSAAGFLSVECQDGQECQNTETAWFGSVFHSKMHFLWADFICP